MAATTTMDWIARVRFVHAMMRTKELLHIAPTRNCHRSTTAPVHVYISNITTTRTLPNSALPWPFISQNTGHISTTYPFPHCLTTIPAYGTRLTRAKQSNPFTQPAPRIPPKQQKSQNLSRHDMFRVFGGG